MRRANPRPKAIMGPRTVNVEGFGVLSKREEQVLSYAAAGFIDKEIGPQLGISVNTLRTFWQRIRQKVGDLPRSGLAASYVTYIAQTAANKDEEVLMPDWEIDLKADRIHFFADSDHPMAFLEGRSLADVVSTFVPQEQAQLTATIEKIKQGELDSFFLIGAMTTPTGQGTANVYVQVERDDKGKAVRLVGKRMPVVNVAGESIPAYDEEIDLEAKTFTRISNRPIPHSVEVGETVPLEQIIHDYHPDDQPMLRTLLACARAGKLDTFNFTGRIITNTGIVPSGAHVVVSKDANGKVCRLNVRQALNFALAGAGGSVIGVGAFTYDPHTGKLTADSQMCGALGLKGDETNTISAIARKLDATQAATFRNLFKNFATKGPRTFGITYKANLEGAPDCWLRFDFAPANHGDLVQGKIVAFH